MGIMQGCLFEYSIKYWYMYAECTHKNRIDERFQMRTHNIFLFHDEIRKHPQKHPSVFVFLGYGKNFLGTQ